MFVPNGQKAGTSQVAAWQDFGSMHLASGLGNSRPLAEYLYNGLKANASRPSMYQEAYHLASHLISTCPAALHGRAFPRIRRTQKDTGTHRAQPLAELSLTERSEVLRPSEARCSVRAKRGVMPRRRRRVKLGCVQTRMRLS